MKGENLLRYISIKDKLVELVDGLTWGVNGQDLDTRYVNVTGDTMTGNLTISNTASQIIWEETDATTDEKQWRVNPLAGNWRLQTLDDAGANPVSAMTIDRAGTTPTAPTFSGLSGTGTRAVQASAAGLLSAFSGTGIVSASSGVLSASTAPTFTDFTNANHDHGDADDGGNIPSTSVTGLGLVWIATNSPSGVATSSFDSCFTSTYENYLIIADLSMSASNANLVMRLRVGGADASGATYLYQVLTTAAGTAASGGATSWLLMGALGVGVTATDYHMHMTIHRPQVADETQATALYASRSSTPALFGGTIAALYNATTQYDGFTIFPSSGNITGTIRVYGYRNS